MNLKKKSIEGLKWSFIETIGVRLFSVSTYFILAKLLSPTAFGLVALTNTFIFFSEVFVEQGFVAALVQKKNLELSHLSSAFWGNLALGALLFGITYVCSPWIASLYEEPVLADILRVHALTYIISSFAKVHLALLQRELQFKKIAVARTIAIVVSCIVSIVLAYLGYGAWSLVFQQIIFNILQTLILWIVDRWKPAFIFSWSHYKSIFSFGSKVMMNRFTMYLIRYTDTLLIGYFLGTGPLGYYSFAQKIFITLTDLVDLTFNKVTFSVFSLLQDQREKLSQEFHKFVDLIATISFPLFAGAFVFTPTIVPLFFGDKWTASIPVIQILSVAGVLACFYSCLNNLFGGIGKVGTNLKIKIGYLILSLVLMYIAVQYSIEMVAATYIFAMLITLVVMLSFMKQQVELNAKQYLITLGKPLLVSVFIAFLVYTSSMAVKDVTLPIIVLQVFVSITIYLGYLLLTKPNFMNEIRSLSNKKPIKAK
uniref:MOP flippase family protein n=1 Tax=Roseihalotalea indica TaxID=2867963 RepID=A0AA49JK10_9BACT|nr:MOP flippase family protein [Tunicatimonas sp. TK19036]